MPTNVHICDSERHDSGIYMSVCIRQPSFSFNPRAKKREMFLCFVVYENTFNCLLHNFQSLLMWCKKICYKLALNHVDVLVL